VFPQEPYRSHLEEKLPARALALWPYTDMGDPRWTWGAKEIRLRQDRRRSAPQKAGFFSTRGWMVYEWRGHVFVKRHAPQVGKPHADFGCNVETFTNADMLELETLGPLVRLAPGQSVTHTEHWGLFKGALGAAARKAERVPAPV
jgi:hypothetical protein